jgi:Zn-dependent peptidase ImmA (M78 family)
MEPLIQKLCSRWRMVLPEAAIIKAVNTAFPGLQKIEPPVDVQALAVMRGVVKVRAVTLAVDGTISLVKEGEYLIELNKAHSENRRRFTCGHEIGHTFFFELDDEINVRSRLRIEDGNLESMGINKTEEYLCNVAASEILMPRLSFSSRLSSLGPSSETALTLSRLFKTSLWSTALRMVQISRFKLLIALWEYKADLDCYLTRWIVCSTRSRYNTQFVVDRNSPIYKTFQTGPVFRGRRLISLGGPIEDYFVDGAVLQQSNQRLVLTVFILEAFAKHLLGKETKSEKEVGQAWLF